MSHVLIPDDESGYHYGAFLSSNSDVPIAVISVFKEPFPVDLPSEVTSKVDSVPISARFRKFACDPQYQGRGVGTAVLNHVFAVASSELGCNSIWCDARLSSAGWYERRGMVIVGDTFFKSGVEYVRMLKSV